jgi:hypothetical protein
MTGKPYLCKNRQNALKGLTYADYLADFTEGACAGFGRVELLWDRRLTL